MIHLLKSWTAAGCIAAVLSACAGLGHPSQTSPASPPPDPAVVVENPGPLETRVQPLAPAKENAAQTLEVSRDGALLTAVLNNRTIETAEFGPRINSTYIPEARAVFDPEILASVSIGQTNRPLTTNVSTTALPLSATATTIDDIQQALAQIQRLVTTLDNLDTTNVSTDSTSGRLSVQQMLPTGTLLYLTGEAADIESTDMDDTYQSSWTFGLTQPLLRGAGTSVNLVSLRQAKNRAEQSKESFRATLLDTVYQVEIAYWDLTLASEVAKIREFAVKLADEQLRRNEEWLAVGKVIEGDVMAARAEKATRSADLMDAQAAIRTQNITLVRLLNPAAEDPWKIEFRTVDPPDVAEVPLDPDTSEKRARSYRPELAQARYDLANAHLELIRTKNGLLPQLNLVSSYGRISQGNTSSALSSHLDDSEFDNYQVGLEFQTPILNRAEKARYHRTKLTSAQMERSVANLEQLISADVRQAIVEVQKQWQRIGATEEAKQSREEQLRVAEGRNTSGKTTNLDLLLVQRDYIQAQVDEITAKIQYIQALTALYAAEGTLLDRRGITIDFSENAARDF